MITIFFWGGGGGEHEAVSRTFRPEQLVLPPPPPAYKAGAKGGGGAGRNVTQVLFCGLDGPYGHANASSLAPVEGGNAVPFCCFVLGSASLVFYLPVLLIFSVTVWKNFSGANFCFRWSFCGLVFSVLFGLGFCFMVWRFDPEARLKNMYIYIYIFMSGLPFWVRSLNLNIRAFASTTCLFALPPVSKKTSNCWKISNCKQKTPTVSNETKNYQL